DAPEQSIESAPEVAAPTEASPIERHLDHLPQPDGWSAENDLELLDMAMSGYITDDCARAFKRPPTFIRQRFDQLTGKRDGIGQIFQRGEVRRAMASRHGVVIE